MNNRPIIVCLCALMALTAMKHCKAQWRMRGGVVQPSQPAAQPQYYAPQQPAPLIQPPGASGPTSQASRLARLDELKDGHEGYNAGDVADVPSGADKLYMTLVTSDDWQTDQSQRGKQQRALVGWLANEPRLAKYRNQSNFVWLFASDPAYTGMRTLANGQASSLKLRLGEAYPILAIENATGEALFKMSALSLPANQGELGDWVTDALKHKAAAGGLPGLDNPPPFRGQRQGTPIITEGLLHFGNFTGFAGQCGPNDDCRPNPNGPPSDNSEVIDDTPRPLLGPWQEIIVAAVFFFIVLFTFGGLALGIAVGAHFLARPRTA